MHLKKFLPQYRHKLSKEVIKYILKLLNSLYVDNCVASVNSMNELHEFIRESKNVMDVGKFNLRGWEYNGDDSQNMQTNVLGIMWDKRNDTLSLNTANLDKMDLNIITKRKILSVSHRIFDPLGLAAPVTLVSRILLQETCNKGLSWDQEIDDDLKKKFFKWFDELKNLTQIQVSRCVLGDLKQLEEISLHKFCDASQYAYAAVTFLRVKRGSSVKIGFVQAKSRVAPSKTNDTKHSIPRLELLAATIGARMANSILKMLEIDDIRSYFWTDSTTVLAWIQRENNWGVFVWNRVKEIKQLSKAEQWFHVPGNLNPADLPSRGCSVAQLLSSKWWEGPEWLIDWEDKWPQETYVFDEQEINIEMRKSTPKDSPQGKCFLTLLATKHKDDTSIFERYSEYSKILKVIGWIKRFRNNASKMSIKCYEKYLTADEIKNSELTILKTVQSRFF